MFGEGTVPVRGLRSGSEADERDRGPMGWVRPGIWGGQELHQVECCYAGGQRRVFGGIHQGWGAARRVLRLVACAVVNDKEVDVFGPVLQRVNRRCEQRWPDAGDSGEFTLGRSLDCCGGGLSQASDTQPSSMVEGWF